jgi:hypothetical protein
MTLPGTKADCHREMILWRKGLSREARIFEMILYIVLQRLIGRNWLTYAALSDFGMRVMKVWLISVRIWPIVKKLVTASIRSRLMTSQ